jgi:predicted Zn-dependent protease
MPTQEIAANEGMPAQDKAAPKVPQPVQPKAPQPVQWLQLLPTVALAILVVTVVSLATSLDGASDSEKVTANPAPLAQTSLGLRVASKPQQVEILWNHDSSAIQAAENGTIRISDGDIAETVPFDARRLQEGTLVYRPRTRDVNVSFEVREPDGQQISESVRAVATP